MSKASRGKAVTTSPRPWPPGRLPIGAPGAGGLGSLTGGSLEGSNVDISAEFSNLIIAQREFEANAKSITTFDEVMQDTSISSTSSSTRCLTRLATSEGWPGLP